jgi:hypothetical protein
MRDFVMRSYLPEDTLVFVERRGRLFKFVHWVGEPDEALAAVRQGILRANEIDTRVHLLGTALGDVKARVREARVERARFVLTAIDSKVQPGFHAGVRGYGLLAKWLIATKESALLDVRRRQSEWMGFSHLEAMALITEGALEVGSLVRSIRWPDPDASLDPWAWRQALDGVAKAVEWGAAALAEPQLTGDQVREMYWPLDHEIPLARVVER